jgi:hypothetical protein
MLRDFVGQTTTAPGTGTTITLGAALTGFRAFSANNAFANGAAVFYFLTDNSQGEWGYATLVTGSPDTLTGRTPLSNTAGTTSRLNFVGTTYCYNAMPSARATWQDNAGALVGQSIPTSFQASLHVQAGTYYTTGAGVDLDGGGTIRIGALLAGAGYAFVSFNNNVTTVGSIQVAGGGVAYQTTSDYRLKTTYGPSDGALIDEIPVHHAAWNTAPDYRYPMLLAHELSPMAGFAVWGEKGAVNAKTGEIEPQQVAYSLLIPALIARVKYRGRQADALEARVLAMEHEMRAMRTLLAARDAR